jgi:hypothetical protein
MTSLAQPRAASRTILARITSRYGDVYFRARASRSRRSATLNATRYGLVRGIVPESSLATQSVRTHPDSESNIRHRTCVTEYLASGPKGGEATGPNPVDRGKLGSKYHLLVDRQGIPLAVQLSAANAHDSTYLECTVDAIPPIFGPPGKPGRPPFRPEKLHADKGYD